MLHHVVVDLLGHGHYVAYTAVEGDRGIGGVQTQSIDAKQLRGGGRIDGGEKKQAQHRGAQAKEERRGRLTAISKRQVKNVMVLN